MSNTPQQSPADRYQRLLARLEAAAPLDVIVAVIEPVAARLISRPAVRRIFHGDATGIPVHVIAQGVPVGSWFMAQYLDLWGDAGSRRSARRLIALGLATAAPTAISGWAEWARSDRESRRVGLVHAAANSIAIVTFAGSWTARARGRDGVGVGLARLGGVLLVVGRFLGGHLRSGRHFHHGEPRD